MIPCYNEAEAIASVVEGVREYLTTVIVVDDGSKDNTSARATANHAEVIRNPINKGKGASLRTAFQQLRALGFLWALTLDGDGQHSPADIPTFFRCAEQSGASLVIGNRMTNPGKMPWLRQKVNRWMSLRLSRAAGVPLPDSQCGFRLVNLAVAAEISLSADHFETESELVLGFAKRGAKISFVPIEVIYHAGGSKINPVVDTWRWLRWWVSRTPMG